MMMTELDGGNPVFYGGSSDSGGHAFVLDGYTDNGYFHVNWGWSGYCNGYFLLSALNPDGQGAGGSAGGYNNGQDALVGLKRDEGGEWTVSLGFEAYEDPEDGTVYRGLSTDRTPERNVPFTLSGGLLYNMGAAAFSGDVIFAVTDAGGNIVQRLFGGPVNEIEPNYGFCVSGSVTVTSPVLEGYRIRALYRGEGDSVWNVARGNEESGCVWEIPLLSTNAILESTRLTYNKTDGLLHVLVESEVSVSLYASDGTDLSDICERRGDEVTVDSSLLPAGRCRLVLKNEEGEKELTLKLKE
ncbi:MAG: C10 family peptidase [Bacteroidetes bacterium]|uniref:C10 family peptidase n=1 Tax=Candidatus Cryptobacteroides merdavium TaxID=2840769 RepID=A0A9D9EEL2_9BACT|nr:C10 family peptidase [Candidatus Cryptobacteroides merdavium]